jgi:2-keto-4-pentenoate hydratase
MLKYVGKVVEALIEAEAIKAVKYVSIDLTIKATRRVYGRKMSLSKLPFEIVLTIGKPNYAERQFIRDCKIAGEPFPVKKIQLWPKKARP